MYKMVCIHGMNKSSNKNNNNRMLSILCNLLTFNIFFDRWLLRLLYDSCSFYRTFSVRFICSFASTLVDVWRLSEGCDRVLYSVRFTVHNKLLTFFSIYSWPLSNASHVLVDYKSTQFFSIANDRVKNEMIWIQNKNQNSYRMSEFRIGKWCDKFC